MSTRRQSNAVLVVFFLSVFCLLNYQVWAESDGWQLDSKLLLKIRHQRMNNANLQEINHTLEKDISRYEHSDVVLEQLARNKLGFVKPHERFYRYRAH